MGMEKCTKKRWGDDGIDVACLDGTLKFIFRIIIKINEKILCIVFFEKSCKFF